jgi:hypothetical protein
VLAEWPRLRELAERCGQAGEVESLAFFLSTPENMRKTPNLVLLGAGDSHAENLLGAVLLYEYRVGRVGTRIFATGDSTGRRNVWAPQGSRARVAAQAARILMERGARVVQIVYPETHVSGGGHWSPEDSTGQCAIAEELGRLREQRCAGTWALLEREIPLYLPLGTSVDETLARMGRRTRTHLRYYRRRSEKDLGCEFIADARMGLEALAEFNRRCTYPFDEEALRWRAGSLTKKDVFLHGIRDRDGQWLALVCGRRHNGFAEIDWQMNRADRPSYSLSSVMRAYLIEHEVAQGSTRLYMEGGTTHPIVHSFRQEKIGELTVKRRSWRVWLMERFAERVLPEKNYLGQTLKDAGLEWRGWS